MQRPTNGKFSSSYDHFCAKARNETGNRLTRDTNFEANLWQLSHVEGYAELRNSVSNLRSRAQIDTRVSK
jgi:hypothetical protein